MRPYCIAWGTIFNNKIIMEKEYEKEIYIYMHMYN